MSRASKMPSNIYVIELDEESVKDDLKIFWLWFNMNMWSPMAGMAWPGGLDAMISFTRDIWKLKVPQIRRHSRLLFERYNLKIIVQVHVKPKFNGLSYVLAHWKHHMTRHLLVYIIYKISTWHLHFYLRRLHRRIKDHHVWGEAKTKRMFCLLVMEVT